MKNIQIIDGAVNSTFEIYEVSDELFHIIFPENADVAFLSDVDEILEKLNDKQIWEKVYKKKVDKKFVIGIHGTLHLTGSFCEKGYFPSFKEEEVLRFIR